MLSLHHIIAKTVLVLAVLSQTLLPFGVASAGETGGVSRYLCSQTVSNISRAAQDEVRELLGELGLVTQDEDAGTQPEHCASCILTLAAIDAHKAAISLEPLYGLKLVYRLDIFPGFSFNPQGPPLGSRAPPALS